MLKDNLNGPELQSLTLMVGSRKALQAYLGMERREFDKLWETYQLKSPTEYCRGLETSTVMLTLIEKGSIQKAAEYYGVSLSFLKGLLRDRNRVSLDAQFFQHKLEQEQVERYGSVRLVARMTNRPEGEVRKFVKERQLEGLLKYDFSDHNNAKGRRAELYWAELEGDKIQEDLNVTQGSQAPYDFLHSVHGKVNVKSSKAHKYTAQTRKGNPLYWKISCSGLAKADAVAIVLYDQKMQEPVHTFTMKVNEAMLRSKSVRISLEGGKPMVVYSKRG